MNEPTWHQQMLADLVVAGMAERTQEAYLRAVRQLQAYYNGTDPTEICEQQVKDYLLWMRAEKRAAPGTLRIAIGGLRFYYRQTFPTDWKVLDRFRIPKEKKLPHVLTVLEVKRIMHAVRTVNRPTKARSGRRALWRWSFCVGSCSTPFRKVSTAFGTTAFCRARRRQISTCCEPSFCKRCRTVNRTSN